MEIGTYAVAASHAKVGWSEMTTAQMSFPFVIATALVKPLLERVQSRRQQENPDHVARQGIAERPKSLPIDIEGHIATGRQRFFNRGAESSVKISENLCPFEKGAGLNQSLERGAVLEMVIDAVAFTRPGLSGRDADRAAQVRLEC